MDISDAQAGLFSPAQLSSAQSRSCSARLSSAQLELDPAIGRLRLELTRPAAGSAQLGFSGLSWIWPLASFGSSWLGLRPAQLGSGSPLFFFVLLSSAQLGLRPILLGSAQLSLSWIWPSASFSSKLGLFSPAQLSLAQAQLSSGITNVHQHFINLVYGSVDFLWSGI